MSRSYSPLRYPGGKSCLYELTARILRANDLERGSYAEPYAGGCGLALSLMYEGHVAEIHINDFDPSIWAFWYSILNYTKAFIELLEQTPVTIDEWYRQRDLHLGKAKADTLELGFATFFLNRTNRSGIIKGAGVIGGLDQTGTYKIDCRFNKDDLSQRVQRIAKYRDRIHLTRMDAVEFLSFAELNLPEDTFFCIDPPYFNKGKSLYTSAYNEEDHADVARSVIALERPWIVTYDDTPEIRSLYKRRRQYSFDINYSVQTKRIGTEVLVASKRLKLPDELRERQINRAPKRAA